VAGKIGTDDQVKVTAFGPVVNLAARLEGMTRQLHASILLDEATAEVVRNQLPCSVARSRRLAVVRPYGLESAVQVAELVPPRSECPLLSDQNLRDYEEAVLALQAGHWERALEMLHRVPAADQVKDFLTVFIAQSHRSPPADWDGVIPLPRK
jgi:adenylate cyclase